MVAALLLVAVSAFARNRSAQDVFRGEAEQVERAMLSQTGLHLPENTPDIPALIAKQIAQTACDDIEVNWITLPGQKHPIPANDAKQMHLPQSLSLRGRHELLQCAKGAYQARPSDFPYFGLIVFGTTRDDEIRGLYYVVSDPRLMIVECPELFGGKRSPETKCGYFMQPEIDVMVRMPRDPAISQLVFFVRTYTGPNQWHLERVGSPVLVQPKPLTP
jgi:hypothetical protein